MSDETQRPSQPRGPVDASLVPRYCGPETFARLPRLDQVDGAAVAVLGIPFDSGVSYRPGARFGPGHIRASSKLLRPYNPALDVSPFAQAAARGGRGDHLNGFLALQHRARAPAELQPAMFGWRHHPARLERA